MTLRAEASTSPPVISHVSWARYATAGDTSSGGDCSTKSLSLPQSANSNIKVSYCIILVLDKYSTEVQSNANGNKCSRVPAAG